MSEKSNRNNPEQEPKKKDCMYGRIAVKAVKLSVNNKSKSPLEAWEEAAKEETTSQSSQKKSCPKNAFLGLCEKGMVKGIKKGSYTKSVKNKKYAIDAVKKLRENSDLSKDKKALWDEASKKSHNGQMDVVISLWKKDLIKKR